MLTSLNLDVSLCATFKGSTPPKLKRFKLGRFNTGHVLLVANQHLQMYTKQARRHSDGETENSLVTVNNSTAPLPQRRLNASEFKHKKNRIKKIRLLSMFYMFWTRRCKHIFRSSSVCSSLVEMSRLPKTHQVFLLLSSCFTFLF